MREDATKTTEDKKVTTVTPNLLSCTDAVKISGLSYWQLRWAVKTGKVDTAHVAGRVCLLRDSVLEFAGMQ